MKKNPFATYSPCCAHSLNLCGVHAAESCLAVITFVGIVQKVFVIFSSSPKRWEILKKHLPCSLHGMSTTRWSARIACVKPFAEHLNCVRNAVEEVLQTNLSADAWASLRGVMRYMNSFQCILMASVWFKVLSAIDQRNKVLQAKDQTVDV